jgi:TatD DNase family protein
MIETDCPYCDIRNSHAGAKYVKTVLPRKDKSKYKAETTEFSIVKDRNEPCTIVQVVEVIAALKGVSNEEIANVSWANTLKMFKIEA